MMISELAGGGPFRDGEGITVSASCSKLVGLWRLEAKRPAGRVGRGTDAALVPWELVLAGRTFDVVRRGSWPRLIEGNAMRIATQIVARRITRTPSVD